MEKLKIIDSDTEELLIVSEEELRKGLGRYLRGDRYGIKTIIGQCEKFGDAWITHDEFLKLKKEKKLKNLEKEE